MIKTNFLDSLSTVDTTPVKTSKSKIPLLIGVLVLVAGTLAWLQPWASEEEVIATVTTKEAPVVLEKPSKPLPSIQSKHDQNVEEVVHDIHAEVIPKPPKTIRITEDIASARASLAWGLNFLSKVSAQGVEYSDIILKAPNYFFLRGIVDNAGVYRNFKVKLKDVGNPLKAVAPKGIGISKVAQEFQFYGKWKKSLSAAKLRKLHISKASALKLSSTLTTLAKKSGVSHTAWKVTSSKKHGSYKRTIAKAQLSGNYKNLVAFIKAVNRSKTPVGVLQLSLGANAKQTMSATINWVYYTK